MDIRPIQPQHEIDEVYRLIHDMYANEGYIVVQPSGKLVQYPHLDNTPETTTYVAVENGEIVGTVAITIDGPNKLPPDVDFPKETAQIRRSAKRPLSAVWRLAIKHKNSPAIIWPLMNTVIEHMNRNNVRTCLFMVNPKHERIYHKVFAAETVACGECALQYGCPPAVLLKCDLNNVNASWLRFTQKHGAWI